MKTLASCIALAVLATGCASTAQVYRPIVDPKFGDQTAYPAALAECRSFAAQIDQGGQAAAGAIAGALLGVAVGAAFGVRGRDLSALAGTGALFSGVRSAEYAGMTQQQIIARCLGNRGYSVLG